MPLRNPLAQRPADLGSLAFAKPGEPAQALRAGAGRGEHGVGRAEWEERPVQDLREGLAELDVADGVAERLPASDASAIVGPIRRRVGVETFPWPWWRTTPSRLPEIACTIVRPVMIFTERIGAPTSGGVSSSRGVRTSPPPIPRRPERNEAMIAARPTSGAVSMAGSVPVSS